MLCFAWAIVDAGTKLENDERWMRVKRGGMKLQYRR